MNVIVKLDNVTKKFDNNVVIKNVSLDVYEGEFLTLLGPSGCGKTTILKMISGLEKASSGKVYIGDVDVTNVDPTKRDVNTIFQNFALFPNMSVYDNVAFGLKVRKVSKKEIDKRVHKVIKLVNLDGFENRLPSELSGGQQQRVAIARGIIMNPKVLLLDESLCSLDLKLKRKMQIELKKLQKKLGITFIYVTHDQDEALTMSDRIAIINEGVIEQLDTPQNIYRKPKTVFVADFIGESNVFNAVVTDNKLVLDEGIKFDFSGENGKVKLILRPEIIKISHRETKNSFKGTIEELVYDGVITKLEIVCDKTIFKVTVTDIDGYKIGDEVYISIEKEKMIIIR